MGSKRLHGQGAGDLPTLPLDDHSCGGERSSHPLPNRLLHTPADEGPSSTLPGRAAMQLGPEGEGGRARGRRWTPVPKSFRGLEENIKLGECAGVLRARGVMAGPKVALSDTGEGAAPGRAFREQRGDAGLTLPTSSLRTRRLPRSGSARVLPASSACLHHCRRAELQTQKNKEPPTQQAPGSPFHASQNFWGALWTKGGKMPFASCRS